MRQYNFKNIHLFTSALIIIGVALAYGVMPNTVLPMFFDFDVKTVDLHNIFRAIMGLYLGMAMYWIVGVIKDNHWRGATISNVVFMGGLAAGRIISIVIDGVPSLGFTIGLGAEILIMVWGIFNLKKY